jgi:hypothetical protein
MTTALMSIFDSFASSTHEALPLVQIIDIIRSNDHYLSIDELREKVHFGDKKGANDIKISLPAFTPSGVFNTKRNSDNLQTYSGILHVDIDKISDARRLELSAQLMKEKDVFAFFRSPSGNGLKIFFIGDKSKENHERQMIKLYAFFEKKYGIQPDKSCKDLGRLCFFSHDPDAYYNPDAVVIKLNDTNHEFEQIARRVNKERKLYFESNSRNNFIFQFGLFCKRANYELSDVVNYSITKYECSDFNRQEINNTICSAYKDEYTASTKQITFESKFDLIAQALSSMGYQFKRNIVKNGIEFSFQDGPWMDLTEIITNDLIRELHNLRIKATDNDVRTVLNSSQYESFDPFADYLHNLPPWDGYDYMGELYETLNTSKEYESYLRTWLKILVASMIDDSINNPHVLTLIGPQGAGKTRWLNKLIPPSLKQYRNQGILDLKEKDTKIALAENLIINIDELDALNRSETARFKELITSPGYKVRSPYGKTQEYRRRTASFCASVNNPQFLMDKTGSRRYLCIELKGSINHMHNVDMDKVFAQAYAEYCSNRDDLYFDAAKTAEIQLKNESFKTYSMEEELLMEFVRKPTEGETYKSLSATEIARYIAENDPNFLPNNHTNREIGTILSNRDFERTKSNGINKYKTILLK